MARGISGGSIASMWRPSAPIRTKIQLPNHQNHFKEQSRRQPVRGFESENRACIVSDHATRESVQNIFPGDEVELPAARAVSPRRATPPHQPVRAILVSPAGRGQSARPARAAVSSGVHRLQSPTLFPPWTRLGVSASVVTLIAL